MSEHTPTPWVAGNNDGYSAWTIWSGSHPSGYGSGKMVAQIVGDSAETDDNAAFIVEAVNSHESLKAEVSRLRSELEQARGMVERQRDLLEACADALAASEYNSDQRLASEVHQAITLAVASTEGQRT